jgi:hypothetical protein
MIHSLKNICIHLQFETKGGVPGHKEETIPSVGVLGINGLCCNQWKKTHAGERDNCQKFEHKNKLTHCEAKVEKLVRRITRIPFPNSHYSLISSLRQQGDQVLTFLYETDANFVLMFPVRRSLGSPLTFYDSVLVDSWTEWLTNYSLKGRLKLHWKRRMDFK